METTRYLQFSVDGSAPTRVELTQSRYVIGRSSTADIRIDDLSISRRHAELFRDGSGNWWIRDLQSSVGTQVDGAMVSVARLHGGEQLTLGTTQVQFLPRSEKSQTRSARSIRLESRTDMQQSVASLDELGPPRLSVANLRALQALGQMLSEIGATPERLDCLCRHIAEQLGASVTVRVLRVNSRRLDEPAEILIQHRAARERLGADDHYVSRSVLRRICESREPVMASNDPLAVTATPVSIVGSPLTVLAAALGASGEHVDVLYVTSSSRELAGAEWLALTSLAATQYNQAEAAWRLHERLREHEILESDLKRAREIQSRLIPDVPACAGLDLAFAVEPCRFVGGDYLDIPVCSPDRIVLCVGDVCGKGLSAALLTGNVHALIRAAAMSTDDLTTHVRSANDYFCQHLPADAFVTLLILECDPRSGAARFVCAGHMAPVSVTRERARWLTGPTCTPLGVAAVDPQLIHHELERDEWLVLMTDGVTETANARREFFGDARLLESFAAIARNDPPDSASFLKAVQAEIDRFQGGGERADDRTCLILRRSPHSQ